LDPARFQLQHQLTQQATAGENWIVARTLEDAEVKAKEKAGDRKYTLSQDEDVLDTWFSSGLWPFSTMGWPEKVSYVAPPAGIKS
jgi:valyl-tRNA synthetase